MFNKISRHTGSGAIAVTIAPGKQWELEGFRLHLDASGAATDLTVTVDSGVDSVYDAVIFTTPMNGTKDVDHRWNPTEKFTDNHDKVVFAYANGDSATWGLEVIYRLLGA